MVHKNERKESSQYMEKLGTLEKGRLWLTNKVGVKGRGQYGKGRRFARSQLLSTNGENREPTPQRCPAADRHIRTLAHTPTQPSPIHK